MIPFKEDVELGFFTHNYGGTSSGIAKNAQKKTGIRLFFDIFGRRFWQLIEINMLYFIFYIPLMLAWALFLKIDNLKIGIAAALSRVVLFSVLICPVTPGKMCIMRKYRLVKHYFILKDFFSAFRENFVKSSLVGFIDILIIISLLSGFLVYPILAAQYESFLLYVPMVLSISVAIVAFMMNFYIFLMINATDLSMKNLIKNAFALVFLELKRNLFTFFIVIAVLLAIVVLVIRVSYSVMFILPFFPATILALVICFNSYPIIQKYVINPYYTSMGQINPELCADLDDDEDYEQICEDMGGKEKPVEHRKKGKGRRIS